jgi:predicted secreted hydrolase
LADDGTRYSFIVSFFEGQVPNIGAVRGGIGGITDVAADQMHQTQVNEVGPYAATTGSYNLEVGGWTASGAGRDSEFSVATTDGYALDLGARSLRPAAYEFNDGVFPLPTGGTNFYYSRTRELYTGTLTINGGTKYVVGTGDFDHEWGPMATTHWAWTSAELTNGEDLIAYTVFDFPAANQSMSGGLLVHRDCSTEPLAPTDVTMTLSGSWTSPSSGIQYPNQVAIDLPSRGLSLTYTPVIADQELHAAPPFNNFYEGGVTVEGTDGNERVVGRGYLELMGFPGTAHP